MRATPNENQGECFVPTEIKYDLHLTIPPGNVKVFQMHGRGCLKRGTSYRYLNGY